MPIVQELYDYLQKFAPKKLPMSNNKSYGLDKNDKLLLNVNHLKNPSIRNIPLKWCDEAKEQRRKALI